MSGKISRPDLPEIVADILRRLRAVEATPAGTGVAQIDHNDVEVGSEPILDFQDTSTVVFSVLDFAADRIQVSADSAVLNGDNVQPGSGLAVLETATVTGTLNTNMELAPYLEIKHYKTTYDAGFRLQCRGVWNVIQFVDRVGFAYSPIVPGPHVPLVGIIELASYSPVLTTAQTVYTGWTTVDVVPTGMTDEDSMWVSMYAGNTSFFFNWQMGAGTVLEFRWVPTGTEDQQDGIIAPGTVTGRLASWNQVKGAYEETSAVQGYSASGDFVGFYGTAPIAQPTVPGVGVVTVQDVVDALKSLGLIDQ